MNFFVRGSNFATTFLQGTAAELSQVHPVSSTQLDNDVQFHASSGLGFGGDHYPGLSDNKPSLPAISDNGGIVPSRMLRMSDGGMPPKHTMSRESKSFDVSTTSIRHTGDYVEMHKHKALPTSRSTESYQVGAEDIDAQKNKSKIFSSGLIEPFLSSDNLRRIQHDNDKPR